jgi:hypothetical protein
MFNLFENEEEAYNEAMKLRFLLDRVQHNELKVAIAALKVRKTSGEEITFTSAANHLASELSNTQDFLTSQQRRSNVSSVSFNTANRTAPTIGIMKNGEVFTGYLPHWNKLSKAEKAKVTAERERLGIKSKKSNAKGKSQKGKAGRRTSAVSTWKKDFKEFKDEVEDHIVAAIKKACNRDESSDDDNQAVSSNAGTSFGGRNAKKAKKEQN